MLNVKMALAQSRFFEGLSAPSRQRLAEISSVKEVRKRQTLFAEGEEGQAVGLLGRGGVQLHKTAEDGREIVIRLVKPGEVFAEVILFEQPRYPVTAVALAPGEVVWMPRCAFRDLLNEETFRSEFIAALMRKLRYLTGRVLELTTDDVEARLLRFLEDHAEGQGAVDMTLSKKDVAAAIGTTPETLSRLLQRLEQDEILSWKKSRLEWREPK